MAALLSKKPSRQKRQPSTKPTARHLWLASLGAIVAVRRETRTAAQRIAAGADGAATRILRATSRARSDLSVGIADVRSQVQPNMLKLSHDVEARLAPIVKKLGLDTFGLKAKQQRAPRKGRKPAASKPTLRRATRKAAKGVARKAAH